MEYFKSFNKKVLVLHGLGSEPNSHRQKMLEKLGFEVIQEHHNYKLEWEKDKGESFFNKQLEIAKTCNLIIGISFGGYVAYHLSHATGINTMLINPALDRSKSKTEIKDYIMNYNYKPCQIELYVGENDKSVPPENAIDYMKEHDDNVVINTIPKMEHRVPDEFFVKILKLSKFSKI